MSIFTPGIDTRVGYESPVAAPTITPQPERTIVPPRDFSGAIDTITQFIGGVMGTGGGTRQPSSSDRSRAMQGEFLEALDRVEAIRQTRGTAAARIAENQLARNLASAGLDVSDFKDVYETATGRSWGQYGRDFDAMMLESLESDPKIQTYLTASFAVLPDANMGERFEWAIGQKAKLEAAELTIAQAKAGAQVDWLQQEAAYNLILDGFTESAFGGLVQAFEAGRSISQTDIEELRVQFGILQTGLSRPPNITDAQWKATQSRIELLGQAITNIETATSVETIKDDLMRSIAGTLTAGELTLEQQIVVAATLQDMSGLALSLGINLPGTLREISKANANMAQISSGSWVDAVISGDMSRIKAEVGDLSAEEYFDQIVADGTLTALTGTNRLNDPAAREQFFKGAARLGYVLQSTGEDDFLSANTLRRIYGDRNFIRNINDLAGIDPEAHLTVTTMLNNGLTREFARQSNAMGSIEMTLGVEWDGENYNVTVDSLMRGDRYSRRDAEALAQWFVDNPDYIRNLANGVDLGFMDPPPLIIPPKAVRSLYDRRESLGVITDTLGQIVPDTEAPQIRETTQPSATIRIPQEVANDTAFTSEVSRVSQSIGIEEDWLYQAIAFETAGTFDPAIRPLTRTGERISSATGLIQFLESTAKGLGTSTAELSRMSRAEQMRFVEKYLAPFKGRINNFGDLYMAIHWPAGVGKDDSFVMYREGSPEYRANRSLDVNRDGIITRGEAVARAAGQRRFSGATAIPTREVTADEAGAIASRQLGLGVDDVPAAMAPIMLDTQQRARQEESRRQESIDLQTRQQEAMMGMPEQTPTAGRGEIETQRQEEAQRIREETPKASTVVDQDVQNLIDALGVNSEDTLVFSSQDELNNAVRSGAVEIGDVVVVNGRVRVVTRGMVGG